LPGLKIVVGPPDPTLPPAPPPEAPAPEVHRQRLTVFAAPGIEVSLDVPDDYPSFTFADDGLFFIVAGLIYDRADEDLVQLGKSLAAQMTAGASIEAPVLEFLRHADGEFVAVLVHKPSGRVAVFNDLWGRLPLYTAQTPTQFVIAREPVEILPHLPEIRFDRKTMVEWMAFEYTLNDKWFVDGVDRVAPATLLVVSQRGGAVRAERQVLEVRNLTATEPAGDWQEAAQRYADLYLQGFAARARKLTEKGYRLTSDLSGGFDTRMVLAGARRLDLPVEFYTDDLVSGDESAVALRLAEVCGWRATRVPRGDFVRDAAEWRRWTYLTGGRVNAPTMMGALLVTRARTEVVRGKAARFMGFAGELVRRTPLPAAGYGGFVGALASDVYTRYIGFEDGCRLTGLDWAEYRRHLADTVARWPERGFSNHCRRLYLLAYLGIGNAGEDRHRWHSWTVAPMWSHPLLDFVYRSLGPNMTNFAFFTELLRAVYPKVLEVPIHQRPFRLDSRAAMLAITRKGELRTRVKQHRFVRWLRRRLRDPERWAPRPSAEARAWIREQAQATFRESAAVRATFDEATVARYLETQHAEHRLHQLLTALWFVAEVDKRFPGRVAGPAGGRACRD
jgi:asparagine synthase (glutamine-hydrolysing)